MSEADRPTPSTEELLASLDAVIAREQSAIEQRTHELLERERRLVAEERSSAGGHGRRHGGRLRSVGMLPRRLLRGVRRRELPATPADPSPSNSLDSRSE